MPDHLTPEQRSHAMSRVKTKDGSLEMIVQKKLQERGYKYLTHVRDLPGTPDIVFQKKRVAVFVDGDFWHGYRFPAWQHKLSEFWCDKIKTNRERDQKNFRKLRRRGWRVIRIWEHQIKKDLDSCINRIVLAVGESEA